ncbi:class I SAM-dependent methyltransferase [Salinibacter grassmerensis]|uniref:class I SAM-dependent methyltransferase n=1 Tax=Salinibacter grassmerensis TaxID=3040353 RepID=UPI0021E76872|nr:class I SAM-dependent methyltransferase [Salinibacter grassmerensis]
MSRYLALGTTGLALLLAAGGLLYSLGPDERRAQAAPAPPDTIDTSGVYAQRSPSRNGIGKMYMGREISKVMGHRGANWLERPAREKKERPDLLVDSLPLDPSDTVADIGAGTGYLSFRVAPRVPRGNILAVDIQPEMLNMMRERIDERGVDNVVPVRGTVTNPQLPADSVDLAYMVDAYHEFSHPYEMMTALVEDLTPGGRVVLVEYPREDPSIPIKTLHKMTEAQAKKEMRAVGLEWMETKDMLPRQHFMIFRKPVE